FTPSATGIRRGDITIVDSASGSPHLIRLAGNGASGGTAPAVSVSAESLNFGSQIKGATSSGLTVTVTNSGNAPLTISAVGVTGDFGVSGACVTTLSASDTCVLTITFTPT